MDYKAKIEIDVQEAFDELSSYEQREFIKDNISIVYIEDLIDIMEAKGYKVIEEEYGK